MYLLSQSIKILFTVFGGFILVILFPSNIFSVLQKRIILSDGTVIKAEFLLLSKRIYMLGSNTLGVLTFPQSKISTNPSGY